VSTRDFSWGKGGRCVWLCVWLPTYHPCSTETTRKSGGLKLPGTPWATSACRGTPLLLQSVLARLFNNTGKHFIRQMWPFTCRWLTYRGADKSLARHTSRCILFDGENISFDFSLVTIYIYSIYIPPIMIINRIYENQNLLSLSLVSFLVGLRTYQHPCNLFQHTINKVLFKSGVFLPAEGKHFLPVCIYRYIKFGRP